MGGSSASVHGAVKRSGGASLGQPARALQCVPLSGADSGSTAGIDEHFSARNRDLKPSPVTALSRSRASSGTRLIETE